MDILEQVDELLRHMETRQKKGGADRRLIEAAVLAELVRQYGQRAGLRQWKKARLCLADISQLVAAMLARPISD